MGLSEIRVGVVGVGFIGVAHVEALRRLGVEAAAVVGSSPDRARAKAHAANLPAVVASVEDLVADPTIHAVHIASPNHVHAAQVRSCLDAGKHVICEKPLGLSSVETGDLLLRAEASGLVHAVCFNIRFYPINHQMAAMVAGGDIGTPNLVHGSYLQDWLLLDTDWNWRLQPEIGGQLRAVADIGSHWIDLAQFVSGQRIVEVMAELHTFVPVRRHPSGPVETFVRSPDPNEAVDLVAEQMTTDDGAGILLRFENGARGILTVSQVTAGRKNQVSLTVSGSAAAMSWCSEQPDELWIGHRGRANEMLQRDGGLMAPSAAAITAFPPGHVEGFPDTFRALFAQVYADIEAGHPSPAPAYPTFADGHDAMLVTEAVARSAASQRWEPVARTGTAR